MESQQLGRLLFLLMLLWENVDGGPNGQALDYHVLISDSGSDSSPTSDNEEN